jgi:ABC-2 type transport system permease protein
MNLAVRSVQGEKVREAARTPLAPRYHVTSIPRSLVELFRYRHLLMHMTVRHLRAQYKQSLLGYAWIILNPLAQLLTLAFIFSVVFKAPSEGQPFTLYLALGLLPWIFFSNAVMSGTDSVVGAMNLVTSVYFPREIILIAAVFLTETLAWVPLIFACHILFAIGLSLPLAGLNLFFHDIRFLVGVVLNLWFYFTPIFYSVEIVPERFRFIYDLNPNARFIASYRYSVLSDTSPPVLSLLAAALCGILAFLIGFYIFKLMEPAFADRI